MLDVLAEACPFIRILLSSKVMHEFGRDSNLCEESLENMDGIRLLLHGVSLHKLGPASAVDLEVPVPPHRQFISCYDQCVCEDSFIKSPVLELV